MVLWNSFANILFSFFGINRIIDFKHDHLIVKNFFLKGIKDVSNEMHYNFMSLECTITIHYSFIWLFKVLKGSTSFQV